MDKIQHVKKLTNELLQYCHEYYDLDAPTISDAEYDKKYDELFKLENEANFWLANSPTRKVQGKVLPYLEKVHHSVPMLSADKSTNIEDVERFVGNKEVLVSFKLDGATVVVKYLDGKLIQGLSRGSGVDGENITHTVRMIKNLPLTIPYQGYLEIRGEAVIPWKYYNEMNIDGSLGHPRNVCSGGLRQLDAKEAVNRNIYFYAFTLVNWRDVGVTTKKESLLFLFNNGFDVVCHTVANTSKNAIRASYALDRNIYQLPTDGWCFEYNDLAYGESLGSTGHHDRRLFALKPEVEEYETTLQNIEWTMGKTGQLTPTAIFDPTEIDNTIITKASVHNLSIMKSLRLKIGGKCFVYKANMIIPQILRCEGGEAEIIPPQYCPVCGGKTAVVKENESEVLVCTNSNCSGKLLGRLKFFVSKPAMNIDGLSEQTLAWLIDKGWINSFKDIYHLSDHKDEWQRCEGFGKKSVENILDAIEKSRNVKLSNFICALSIDGIGTAASKTITSHFNNDFDAFFGALTTNYEWSRLSDFGEVTARNIANFGAQNGDMVRELAKEMMFVKEDKKEVKENPFMGKSICCTGKLNYFTRDSINEKIVEIGAKVASGVSAKTDYLLTNTPDSGSSKNVNAKKFGTKIITENEFLKMLEE